MIINILTKSKMQQREADINVSDDPRRVVSISWISGKHSLVGIVGDAYKFFPFNAV